MDKLLKDYIQMQVHRRRQKMDGIKNIPVEVRLGHIIFMGTFSKYSNEVFLRSSAMDGDAIVLNDVSIVNGYSPEGNTEISFQHSRHGNMRIKFSNVDLRDKAITLLQHIFSDESSDSGSSDM